MADKSNIHEEHRIRMREKYRLSRDAMPDHEILEVLLFTVIPRKNTNPIAHDLIRTFGSLEGVFDADVKQLMQVEGVGEKTAFFLKEVRYMWKRIETCKREVEILDSYDKIAHYFAARFCGEVNESVHVLLLDARARVIACQKLFEGTVTTSSVDARRVVNFALTHNAVRAVVAHNHLSGRCEPSEEDISTTRYLRRILHGVDVILEEHFVIAGNSYCPILQYMEKNRKI